MLIQQLRGPADKIEPLSMPADGYRHADQWSFTDAAEALASEAPAALRTLTCPQRLTIADELAADAMERASAAQVLASGNDPESEDSRAWQMREVTRTLRNGQTGGLPEGAASWLVRSWGSGLGPAEWWAARDRLARIEQLVAACKAHGGREPKTIPFWPTCPRPQGVHRPNASPHSPIRHTGQEQLDIPAETWAPQVLTPWQQAAAVTLVVKLPEGTATDDHRTAIRDLTEARQPLDAGDWKGSIRASRDTVEVLRAMHDEHLNPKKTQRTVDEREAAILDAERQLIQSLFDYGQPPISTRFYGKSPGPASTPCSRSPPRPPSLSDLLSHSRDIGPVSSSRVTTMLPLLTPVE